MRKIFLDCGANIGQSVKAWYSCNKDAKSYEVYSFEASKKLEPTLRKKLKKYSNVTIINKVVWIHGDGVKFNDRGNLGSSTEPDKITGGSTHKKGAVFESIDLASFIKENFSPDDWIVLKIDIEGGEYHLIPHLIESGALKYINELYLELHAAKLSTKSIDDDFKLIEAIKEQNLKPMRWSASWSLEHGTYDTDDREITKDYITSFWKRRK